MSTPEGADLRERPTSELLKDLSQQTGTLVRQEIELAKAELRQKGKELGAGAGLLIGATVVALLALGALTACLIAALASAVETWLAALIVAVVYLAIAGALAVVGRGRIQKAAPPAPEQTIETVKEDVQWAKTRARSGRT
jgi:Putative Actinobacterial Holin-X, holin superfamily III